MIILLAFSGIQCSFWMKSPWCGVAVPLSIASTWSIPGETPVCHLGVVWSGEKGLILVCQLRTVCTHSAGLVRRDWERLLSWPAMECSSPSSILPGHIRYCTRCTVFFEIKNSFICRLCMGYWCSTWSIKLWWYSRKGTTKSAWSESSAVILLETIAT